MNRGGIEPSTESACGGMDSTVARVIWEDLVVVHYICGTEAQREVHVKEKREDKARKRLNVFRRLAEGKSACYQTRHKVQEGSEEYEDAPVWWQMEVEGHSYNPRNRNRIRKFLRRKIDYLERRTDLPEGARHDEMKKLESQLGYYQRPPRPEKQTF